MLEGMYSAAAGMAAQQQRLDAAANDLANVSTTGYKRQRLAFRDLLYQPAPIGANPGVTTGSGAAVSQAGRTFAQGSLLPTGRTLDLAIEGAGFFAVRLPDGSVGLTRDGSLQADADGRLVTSEGHPLAPAVRLPAGTDVSKLDIGIDGSIRAGEDKRLIGRVEVVTVRYPGGLRSLGENLFAATDESGATAAVDEPRVRQGALEASNVDMATSMVDLITAQRGFQLASEAIKTQDRLMEIANQVKR